MRKLASVVEIETCEPIPETDRLSVATMKGKGWRVVTARDEYKPGDLAVMFEIDSYLPSDDARYAFLKERCLKKFVSKSGNVLREGIRIKTCKLRGVISQGLLIPIAEFVGDGKEISCVCTKPKVGDLVDENGNPLSEEDVNEIAASGVTVSEMFYIKHHEAMPADADQPEFKAFDEKVVVTNDTDLTELLKVEHYDEVKDKLSLQCGGCKGLSGDALGSFPDAYAHRSDEERIQNLGNWFDSMKGRKWEVTAKFDGTSSSFFYSPTIDNENPFGVCSRNIRLKEFTAAGVSPVYWQMARKYDIENKLKSYYDKTGEELMIQGETVGCGINGNRDLYTESDMFVFRIWNITKQTYMNPSDRRAFCKDNGLKHVQVIREEMDFFGEITTMDDALKFAEGKTLRGNEREGVVLKTCDGGPFASFKIVSNRYLMKNGD